MRNVAIGFGTKGVAACTQCLRLDFPKNHAKWHIPEVTNKMVIHHVKYNKNLENWVMVHFSSMKEKGKGVERKRNRGRE